MNNHRLNWRRLMAVLMASLMLFGAIAVHAEGNEGKDLPDSETVVEKVEQTEAEEAEQAEEKKEEESDKKEEADQKEESDQKEEADQSEESDTKEESETKEESGKKEESDKKEDAEAATETEETEDVKESEKTEETEEPAEIPAVTEPKKTGKKDKQDSHETVEPAKEAGGSIAVKGADKMEAGGTTELSADNKVTDAPENPKFTWSTSDAGVVSVSDSKTDKNTVTAVAPGKAKITVSMDSTNIKSAEFEITVAPAKPELESVTREGLFVEFKWKSSAGAKKYAVYRKTGSEEFKKLTETEELSYKDETGEPDVTYIYTAAAIADDLVSSMDETGLSITTRLDAPVLVAAENTVDGIKVSWNPTNGAEKYNVYRMPAGGSWGLISSVSSKTEFEDTEKLKVGTVYFYTVRALYSDLISSYDRAGVYATALPPQPVLKEVNSVGETMLEVVWEAAEGAEIYTVYRQQDDGTWKNLGKTKKTSFTDKTAPKAVDCTYTVRSGIKVEDREVKSVYINTITGKTITAKEKAQNFASPKLKKAKGIAYNGIKVTWKAAKNADGYRIYRKKAAKGGYKMVGEVAGADKLEYDDLTAKFGTKYTYTVRAYMNYGDKVVLSTNYNKTGVTGTPVLAAPVLKKASPVDNRSGIKVTWEAAAGAQGYKIYRKAGKAKKWKLLVTVKKVTEYTDKTTKANTDYAYTVRALRKVGGVEKLSKYDKTGVKSSTKVTSKNVNGLLLYYDDEGKLIKDTESIIGRQSTYALEVDYDKNIVTVYAKGSGGNYNVPVKAFVCSTGKATPIGTFHTPAKYRWRTLQGPCYGQWCTRITGGVLFHSVPYYTQSNNNLKVYAYNKLGTKCSAGCVRLCCRDAKWIYDNCKLGTRVTVKHNAKNPFGKPSPLKLKNGHTWDPTDPNMAYKCRDKGCH